MLDLYLEDHSLRSAYCRCVHPKTGRVCVPVEPGTEDMFKPGDVPTLRTIEGDLNKVGLVMRCVGQRLLSHG